MRQPVVNPNIFPAEIECTECGTVTTVELDDLEDVPSHLSSTAQVIDARLGDLGWEVDLMSQTVLCPKCVTG